MAGQQSPSVHTPSSCQKGPVPGGRLFSQSGESSPAFTALAQQVSTVITLGGGEGERQGLAYVLFPLGTRLQASSSTDKNRDMILKILFHICKTKSNHIKHIIHSPDCQTISMNGI